MANKANLTIELVVSLFLVGFVAPTAVGKIIYEHTDSTGVNNGSFWANA